MEKLINEFSKIALKDYSPEVYDRLLKELWTSYLRLKNYALGTMNNPPENKVPALITMNEQYEKLEFSILELEKILKKISPK